MFAGIPGTGIGGLFYLLLALWLPIRALLMLKDGHPVRWGLIFRQVALALLLIITMWVIGDFVGRCIVVFNSWMQGYSLAFSMTQANLSGKMYNIMKISILAWALLVIAALHLCMYLTYWILLLRKAQLARSTAAPDASLRSGSPASREKQD